MSRRVQDLELDAAGAQHAFMQKIALHLAALGQRNAEQLRLDGQQVVQWTVGLVNMSAGARPALKGSGCTDVIDMCMGVDDCSYRGAVFFEPCSYVVEIAARIDDDGAAGWL